MNNKGKTDLGGIAVIAVIVLAAGVFLGYIPLGEGTQAIPSAKPTPLTGGCQTDTVTVSFSDLKSALRTGTTATNDVNRVEIDGRAPLTGFDILTTQTMSYGDKYTAYYTNSGTAGGLTAGTDYYGTVVQGTINTCGTDGVTARPYLASSITTWFNNDPSNATTRNAAGAQDVYGAGSQLIPTLYMQVSTQYGAYGMNPNASVGGLQNKGILLFADYNGVEIDSIEPAASLVKASNLSCPPTHAITNDGGDSNQTACTAWELNSYQLAGIGQTLAIPISITADSTYNPQNNINFFVEDADMFIHTDGSFKVDWYTDTGGGVGVAVVEIPYYLS